MRRASSFASRLTPGVTWILALHVAAFLVYIFAGKANQAVILSWLALTPQSILDGHVWKLVTSSILATDGLAFFFDVLMLWMFVPVLERFWGTRRFLTFAIGASLIANVVAVAVGLLLGGHHAHVPIVGLSPFIFGSIAAFGVAYANQNVQLFGVLPLKGKALAVGTAVVLALSVVFNQTWVTGAANFAGMGFAVALTSGAIAPNLWWLRLRRWRLRRHLDVIDGGRPKRKHERWMN